MSVTGRILIVDDEANARSALAELCAKRVPVETAADGFRARPSWPSFHPMSS